jgi:PKD repeat protein
MATKSELPRASRCFLSGLIAVLAVLVPVSNAHAFGSILSTFNSTYPASSSGTNAGCQLCHGQSTNNWNEYGWGLRQNGRNFTALEGLPSVNINGGTTMLDEINASTQPGWTTGANNNLYASGGLISSTQTPPAVMGLLDPAVGNQLPTADANGPYSGITGVSLTFDGTGSSDPDGTIVSYDWDFGDGIGTGTGATPSYTYGAAGTYTVSLTVTDNDGDTDTATSTATITDPGVNQPPMADANGPYMGTTGQPVAFDGTGSNDPDGTIVSYDWDFGDGVGTGSGVTPSYTYASAGTYTVSLTVTDDGGLSDTATSTATITDQGGGGCQGITITQASFGTQGNKNTLLLVEGVGIKNGDFVLYNAYDTANAPLATAKGKSGKFRFRLRNPAPVPCAVRVEQPDSTICGLADVSNAPADCAPQPPVGEAPVGRGDLYSTPVGVPLNITATRLSGVLYNDFDPDGTALSAVNLDTAGTNGTVSLNTDGSFSYTPPAPGSAFGSDNATDSFTYQAQDVDGNLSGVTKVVIQMLSNQTDFKITMNYELGMHCTGFEFAYCCVLPPYNSILAQVIKPAQGDPAGGGGTFVDGFPRLLGGDPVVGLDDLNRETVLRDPALGPGGDFRKYQLRYYHDAQPRQEGNTSKPNSTTLISDVEGNSLQYFNTVFDSAQPDAGNALVYGSYNGYQNVIQGSGTIGDVPTDNYANAWLNHFYIYGNLEGQGATGLEEDKIRLGVAGQVAYPANSGAALQPMGPTGNGAFENVLTFSADTGTVVFTQAKVLEDLPIMLTSPRIWEALGLPLTPFEDTINFFGDPGAVDEDAVRPYVAMKASLHEYPSGAAVIGSNGEPVIGFGTAPIDIPNCERCHSAPSVDPVTGDPNVNSPNWNRGDASFPHGGPLAGTGLEDMTNLEINFWLAYYDIVPGVDSTWYARLKGAAINMLTLHDYDIGTSFTANYAGVECTANPDPTDPSIDPQSYPCSSTNGLADLTDASNIPQNTRLGNESVICQRCHADNVIANVKSGTFDAAGQFPIPPITEAIHNQHRNQSEGGVIVFNDSFGRDGGCQGCHPAHRSDGVMDGYPITLGGNNAQASSDNRLAPGGCFVGRDVHSNPMKDDPGGAETVSHLNAVGDWLLTNVATDSGDWRGIWCTNCHSQLSQEIWRNEDCDDLIRGNCVNNVRGQPTLEAVATAVGLTPQQAIDYLDPKVDGFDRTTDQTHAAWNPGIADANVATIEVGPSGPVGTVDADGDFSVNILSFCTTQDCVDRINNNKADETQWRYPEGGSVDGTAGFISTANTGVAVPFSAATDGRDHWLAPGEPHCADCHNAPYVEQSGNFSPYPPFNYPAKASLMRYTRGHQDVSCQGCHESIHGLYPVSPTIDTTSYAQAAALNHDNSVGPLKCGTCHTHVDANDIPTWVNNLVYNDPLTPAADNIPVAGNYDAAVGWMHTYTEEANPLGDVCQNCHGDFSGDIAANNEEWAEHAWRNRVSRGAMDAAETAATGDVLNSTDGTDGICLACHGPRTGGVANCTIGWKNHLIQGRVAESVWETVSVAQSGTTCGW